MNPSFKRPCLILAALATLLILPAKASAAAAGAYNVVGLEDRDYALSLEAVKRSERFRLDEEKVSFYMLGCDRLGSSSDDRWEFVPRSEARGAKLVFIAPEAGRQSGAYATADFYPHANSILRIKAAARLVFERKEGHWQLTVQGDDGEAELYLEGKAGWNERLMHTGNGEAPFCIDLENYTLSRDGGHFRMVHHFSPSSPFYEMGEKTIRFSSEEILLRTYETRLSASSRPTAIEVVRKPSKAIVGSTIRFTADTDDGDNLATVTGIDSDGGTHIIYISHHEDSYNTHSAGTWLRCFTDGGNGQVYDNHYPQVYLEPSVWSLGLDNFNTLATEAILPSDRTGILQDLAVQAVDNDDFGYALQNVTYSHDGLNFTGGLTGAFDVAMAMNFFGRSVDIGPAHIDYATMANSIMDEILRINTYKREAFRFYFNPYFFESYGDWADLPNPPSSFPLTFRLYFDKGFGLLGGNVKINLPGKGIPLPGGLALVDTIGGGFTYPATFEVATGFRDAGLSHLGIPFWNADLDAVLSLDRAYLSLDGRVWMWNSKFRVGDASALIAWSYYRGKRFKGIEFDGETGFAKGKVSLVFDMGFKIKRYRSNGRTRSYIGGRGRGTVEAFGASFGGIGIQLTSRKASAYVNPPGPIGTKKVTVRFSDITGRRSALALGDSPRRAVATLMDADGHRIVLMPEARRIPQQPLMAGRSLVRAGSLNTTLNLPAPATQAAITIDYQGSIADVGVTLPGGGTPPVVIADEDTVETPGTLYAMDYALDDENRQLYIEIDDADAGDYTLSCTADSVTDTAIYEITQVPAIDEGGVTATEAGGLVDLGWNLAATVPGDVRYHLSLQTVENDQVVAEYPLYENMSEDADDDGEDDGEAQEVYVDNDALTILGTRVSTRVNLPANLPSGTYRFAVEPVLDLTDEDDLEGAVAVSNAFSHTNSAYAGVVTAPSAVAVENRGNGVTRVRWDLDPTVYSWDISVADTNGAAVGTVSILRENLVLGSNLFVDPFSGDRFVCADIGIDTNTFATATLSEAAYATDYDFTVTAVQRVPHSGGAYYNPGLGYIDMNNIEADLNDGDLIYKAAAPQKRGQFVEPQEVGFYIEIYGQEGSEPVFAANLFEVGIGEIGYDYDVDSDLDREGLRQIDPGALVLRTNALDSLKLLPDSEVQRFGIVILSPSGEECLNIPAVSLADLARPENWATLAAELATAHPQLGVAALQQLQQIHAAGAIRLEDDADATAADIRIDLGRLVEADLMSDVVAGRYTVSITTDNAHNDRTITDFEITVRDIVPAPFIESVTPLNGSRCRVAGFANGAATITLNGETAAVTDGAFELTTAIDTAIIAYTVDDEFGNSYSGTIAFDEIDEIDSGGSGGSGGFGCFIELCAKRPMTNGG